MAALAKLALLVDRPVKLGGVARQVRVVADGLRRIVRAVGPEPGTTDCSAPIWPSLKGSAALPKLRENPPLNGSSQSRCAQFVLGS
jgi:hypothetical protein